MPRCGMRRPAHHPLGESCRTEAPSRFGRREDGFTLPQRLEWYTFITDVSFPLLPTWRIPRPPSHDELRIILTRYTYDEGFPMDIDKERRLTHDRFEAIRAKDHIPQPLLAVLEQVAALQLDARERLRSVPIAHEELADPVRHAQGAPLLPRERFPLDNACMDETLRLFDALLELAGASEGPLQSAAQTLRTAIDDGRLDPREAVAAHVAQDNRLFDAWADALEDAPRALVFLAQAAYAPAAAALGEQLADKHDNSRAWLHGHCPVCGSLPLVSELRGREGHKHCVCSFCSTAYRAPRLGCLFCGESAQEKLSFLTAEEERGFRLDLCHSCKTYMKTLDFRELDRHTLPLLDDLDSLALDILAAQEQWRRATFSGWGF